jgi:hypothetical protein
MPQVSFTERMSWLGGRGSSKGDSRKVRTSQSRVIANGNPRRLAGKCHRKQTATLAVVRVKRCGKSAPAFRVTGVARQTPPEARPRRPHLVRSRRRPRVARPSLRVGRSRHPATVCPDGWSPPRRRASSRRRGTESGLQANSSALQWTSNAPCAPTCPASSGRCRAARGSVAPGRLPVDRGCRR